MEMVSNFRLASRITFMELTPLSRLFIMDGVISLPVAVASYWFLPDLPENATSRRVFSDDVRLHDGSLSPQTWRSLTMHLPCRKLTWPSAAWRSRIASSVRPSRLQR
jgi:hypothetical protein